MAQGRQLAAEMGRLRGEAGAANERLQTVLALSQAEHAQLVETQEALEDALEQLEVLANDAEVSAGVFFPRTPSNLGCSIPTALPV